MQQSFYNQLYAATYDIDDARHEMIDYYLNKWQQMGKPSPVLEPMCGTGFFLIPFMEAGAEIDGLDSSPHMLAECKQKCAARGVTPNLLEAYIEEMALPRQYGFIYIPDSSFGHIYDKAIAQACLHKLWEYLLPEGHFILDLRTPPHKDTFPESGQTVIEVDDRIDDATMMNTSVWLERDNGRVIRNVTKHEKFVDGQLVTTELMDYNQRFYDRAEFAAMLTAAGFADIQAVKAFDETEPQAHDSIVYSCRKP